MIDDSSSGPESTTHLPPGATPIDRLLDPLRRLLRLAGLIILALMIATPALQVLMRQVFHMPMIGAEELARFMLISVVMLAVPYTVSSGASVRMEELLHALPATLRGLIMVLIALAGFCAFAFAAYAVLTAMMKNLNNETPTLGIPYYIFFAATGVGFLMTAVEFLVLGYKSVTRRPLYVTFDAEQTDEELTL